MEISSYFQIDMFNAILALLAVLVVLAAVWAIALSFHRTAAPTTDLKQLEALFAARRNATPQFSGGLLVHTMTIEDAERLLGAKDFVLEGNDAAISDCSAPDENNSSSCSAWTYLRSDLMPTIYSTPSDEGSAPGSKGKKEVSGAASAPLVGIIIDPALAWPLISSMSVVDANSAERNCGQYVVPESVSVKVSCTAADQGVGRDADWTFNGPLKASDLCPQDCDENDARCKLQNAGGTIALSHLGASGLGNWGCEDCSGPFPPEGVDGKMAGCSQSTLPFVCSLDDGTAPEDGIVDAQAWAPYSKREGYARAHVGRHGEKLQNLFETPSGLAPLWNVGANQCKFVRDNWDAWVSAVQRYYQTVWKFYDPNTRHLKTDAEATMGKNYLMSCPHFATYFENEVNLYFNRKSTIEKYRELARHQSQILRNAVVGFFYLGKTCKEQLAPLEGSACGFKGKTYEGAHDRCEAWFCGQDVTEACRQSWEIEETAHLQRARDLSRKLADNFNAVYRRSEAKRRAGLFKYIGSNSTFIDMTFLEPLMNKEEISLESVFQEG